MKLGDYFRRAEYLVEISSFERQSLWSKYHNDYTWEDNNMGFNRQIGIIDDRPICVTFYLHKINGLNVLFYEATSQLVDWKMIEDYLDVVCNLKEFKSNRRARIDASNFHNVILYSKEVKAMKESGEYYELKYPTPVIKN